MSKQEEKGSKTPATKMDLSSLAKMGRESIPEFLEVVSKKIQELKGQVKEDPRTTGKSLDKYGRIEDINDVETLIAAHASLGIRKEVYEKSAKHMGVSLKKYPFQAEGLPAEVWLQSIEARLSVVKHKTELERLEKIEKKLRDNLSAEDKLRKDLQDITSMLTEE